MKEATEKAAEEAAIRKDALYDRMIADWKKAALVKAAAKIAAEREADEPALIEDNVGVDEDTTKMAASERGPCTNILSPVEAVAHEKKEK